MAKGRKGEKGKNSKRVKVIASTFRGPCMNVLIALFSFLVQDQKAPWNTDLEIRNTALKKLKTN